MIIIPNRVVLSRPAVALGAVGVAALGVGLLALCVGDPSAGPTAVVSALTEPEHALRVTVWDVRLPRLLMGLVGGAGLAIAGLLLQDTLRNPIAGPELLGVSSGAAVVVAAIVVLGLRVPLALQPWAALGGAALAGALVLLAIGRTSDPAQVVLVGAAVSAACGGLVVAVVGLGTQGNVVVLFRYLLGSLAARGWPHLEVVAPLVGAGIVGAWLLRRPIETLSLGDEVAAGLGVRVMRTRVLAVAASALLAAAVASACGPVAFVALLAPHAARRLLGTVSTRRVFTLAALVGALLMASADLVARQVLYPVEMPVGIATTLVGVPALLLVRRTPVRA